jgi:hypothetical protein
LISGEVRITFEPETQEIIDPNVVLKINITLTSGEAGGIYVSEKSASGFVVKELNNGHSNATFDWMVVAKRKNNDAIPTPTPTPSSPVSSPVLPSVESTPAVIPVVEASPIAEVSSTGTPVISSEAGSTETPTTELIPTAPPTEPAPLIEQILTPIVSEPELTETPLVEPPPIQIPEPTNLVVNQELTPPTVEVAP